MVGFATGSRPANLCPQEALWQTETKCVGPKWGKGRWDGLGDWDQHLHAMYETDH